METKEKISESCRGMTERLLDMCRDTCVNNTSESILYMPVEICAGRWHRRRIRPKIPSLCSGWKNDREHSGQTRKIYRCFVKNRFMGLSNLVDLIYDNQENISWVDFELYYSSEFVTIIITKLVSPRVSEKYGLQYHAAIPFPAYMPLRSNEKFDANWQLLCHGIDLKDYRRMVVEKVLKYSENNRSTGMIE